MKKDSCFRTLHNPLIELKLYTKSNCHLCDVMKNVILKVKPDFDLNLELVDIETEEVLYEMYKQSIPALTINGKLFAKYRLDETSLRNKLNRM